MTRLTSSLQEDYEEQQRARAERRKLKTITAVPKLCELLPEALLKKTKAHRRECTPKFHAEAAKKCKQLPQLLLKNESES